MGEIVKVRDATIIAAEITTIKEQTQRMVLSASIEIGRRLVEAKDLVQHGDWTGWLQEKCNFSQRTADNLMRIYREYGNADSELSAYSNSQTFANLTYSQAVALLVIPADERSDFLENNDVGQMSNRELQEAIKARDAAEKEKARLEEQTRQIQNKLEGTNQLLQIANQSKEQLQEALTQSDQKKAESEQNLNDTISELKEKLSQLDKPASPSPEELKKMRSELRKDIEDDFKKKADRLANEKKSAEDRASEIEKAYEEKLRLLRLDNESIQAREKEAEKQLATASPQIHQCTAYMTSIQQSFGNVVSIISSVKVQNPELSEKLQAGMKKILEQLISQVS